jgi:hypothetical protein
MVQDMPMRLDHFSYVTSHDQLADTVFRIGSRLGTTFIDGGIHPSFGTRNFTAPLINGQYLEVVCPLDHPATQQTHWGKAVTRKLESGGGWLSWVFSTDAISSVEARFGRESVEGTRIRPDGTQLKWKQIGVKDIEVSQELPFFIEWLSKNHPSMDGLPTAEVIKINIVDSQQMKHSLFYKEIMESLRGVEIGFIDRSDEYPIPGILSIEFKTSNSTIEID